MPNAECRIRGRRNVRPRRLAREDQEQVAWPFGEDPDDLEARGLQRDWKLSRLYSTMKTTSSPAEREPSVVIRQHVPLVLAGLSVLFVLGCAAVFFLFWRAEHLELRENLGIMFTECFVKARPKTEYQIRFDALSRCHAEAAKHDAKIVDEMVRCVGEHGTRVASGYVLSPQSMSICFGGTEW